MCPKIFSANRSLRKYRRYGIDTFDFRPLGIVVIVLLQDNSRKSRISESILDFAAICPKYYLENIFLDYWLHYVALLWQDIFF